MRNTEHRDGLSYNLNHGHDYDFLVMNKKRQATARTRLTTLGLAEGSDDQVEPALDLSNDVCADLSIAQLALPNLKSL